MLEVINKNTIWIYDISQCGSHVGNVIQSIGQNITFDRHVGGNKIWIFLNLSRGVDRKVFIVGFYSTSNSFLL
jgi:hypothetical protein